MQKNNDLVNINTIEVSKLIKFFFYYLLNIDKQVSKLYNNSNKLFLTFINNIKKIFKQNQIYKK